MPVYIVTLGSHKGHLKGILSIICAESISIRTKYDGKHNGGQPLNRLFDKVTSNHRASDHPGAGGGCYKIV